MGTDGGWLRLYRSSRESQVWQSERLWRVWCWCLFEAAWKPTWTTTKTGRGSTEVQLQPGQFIFGRNRASKVLKMNVSAFRRQMKKLELIGNITQKATTHYTVVTISHWDTYQGDEPPNRPGNDHPTGQATGQPTTTQQARQRPLKEEGKEVQEGKEGKDKGAALDSITYPGGFDTPEVREAIDAWLDHKRARKQTYKSPAGQMTRLLKTKDGDGELRFPSPGSFVAAVDHSIANNYAGCFPPADGNRRNGPEVLPDILDGINLGDE